MYGEIVNTRQNLCVGDPVLPRDAEGATETAKVETVQLLLLPCVRCPGLTAVEECTKDTRLVNLQCGVFRQVAVVPHSLALAISHAFDTTLHYQERIRP